MVRDQIGTEKKVCESVSSAVLYMKYWYTCLTKELGIVNTLTEFVKHECIDSMKIILLLQGN